jgi:WD40 repeat protein
MIYNIKYLQKRRSKLYNIPNDLLVNIIKYIDFEKCGDLIKILKNNKDLKQMIDYENLNIKKEFNMKLPSNFENKICDNLNIKKNECLRYVYNCHNNYKLLKTLEHSSEVYSVAFNHDGTKIVSGSDDKVVRIWDVKTGELLKTLEGHKRRVKSVAFNIGKYDKKPSTKIVSGTPSDTNNEPFGTPEKSLRVWDLETGEFIRMKNPGTVNSAAFNHDGNLIVSGNFTGQVSIWNVKTGELLKKMIGHTNGVPSVVFNHDGTKIVSGSRDKTVRVWDVATGNLLKILKGHTKDVNTVAFNHDGTKIVSGSHDETIRVWDIENENVDNWKLLKTFLVGVDWDFSQSKLISSIAFNHDGTKIVSSSSGLFKTSYMIYVWDVNTGKSNIIVEQKKSFNSVAFNHDGTKIVSGSKDRTVKIWGLQ